MVRSSDLRLFFATSLIAAISASYQPCERCVTRASPSVLANISIRIYPNTTIADYISVPVSKAPYLLPKINSSKPTVIYISGWTETPDSESVTTITAAYLKRQDHNVMVVDYRHIAEQIYTYALFSVDGIGYTVATALNELAERGFDSSTLHVVGHSLGGQVAGCVGRYANFKLPRITGLDPAGPGFDLIGENLSGKDAKFVDVIHTDAGYYGTNTSAVSFNSYPNGGTRFQPGCPPFRIPFDDADFCDHRRSWHYYAESLLNEGAFLGVQCASYGSFKRGLCRSNAKFAIGYGTPTNASGSFYLRTNGSSPYGLGENGLNYESSPFSITSILFPFARHDST